MNIPSEKGLLSSSLCEKLNYQLATKLFERKKKQEEEEENGTCDCANLTALAIDTQPKI